MARLSLLGEMKSCTCLHKAVFVGVRVLWCRKIDEILMNMKRTVIPRLHDTGTAPEWIFVPGWKSRSGTRTGVNSRRHDILLWYHVNEYRAIRGNRSELAPGWKSPRYQINTPKVSFNSRLISGVHESGGSTSARGILSWKVASNQTYFN